MSAYADTPTTPVVHRSPLVGRLLLVASGVPLIPLGGATLTSYLLLGVLGAPVFAEQESGTDVLSGPTGGYLLGFGLAGDLNTNLERTLELGLYPFVIGDLLKLYLAALMLPTAWRIRDRLDPTSKPPSDPPRISPFAPRETPLFPLDKR